MIGDTLPGRVPGEHLAEFPAPPERVTVPLAVLERVRVALAGEREDGTR